MFVRKVRNRSGSISVQIISKNKGAYRVIQTLGSSKHPDEIACFVHQAQDIINNPEGQLKLLSLKSPEAIAVESFIKGLSNAQIHTMGPELIFGEIFDRVGFGSIDDKMFRHITIARLAYPTSKLKTVDYLRRYKGIDVDKHAIYRFLDVLHSRYKDTVEDIAYKHTRKILKTISIVFYDMTTLYFEAEDEDDLRKIGFSKDGKFQHPQIMLGLLVGTGGYPIGYDVYEGNTFEGHTLMPTLEKIQKRYGFKKPIVIADAALLSKQNLENLSTAQYQFIVGARIKNESEEIKVKILQWADGIKDGDSIAIKKKDGTRLVVTYSTTRAKKDAHNREKGLRKLRGQIKSGRLTKQQINNRGYNKFLTLTGDVVIAIDEDKIIADARWDGLKGYVTNTRLSPKTIVENYRELWQIELAFRISKTDLRIRPIYHYRKRRIEAHICIAFVAYTIYKELQNILNKAGIQMSPKRAAELTHNMYELEYLLPGEVKHNKTLLRMDAEQLLLYNAIHD
jgi:transposase